MKILEIIGIILLGLCVIGILAIFAFYPFPKNTMENISIMNLQAYEIINAFGKPEVDYEIGFISKSGTRFEITIREIREK